MAEVLSKTGTATMTATYAGTAPFSVYVNDIDIYVKADIFDATSGTDTGRRLGKSGLVVGTVTVMGFMPIASGITLASTVVNEETSTGQDLTLAFGTATGAGGGGPTKTLVLKALVGECRVKASKTPGYVAVMLQWTLCGTQP